MIKVAWARAKAQGEGPSFAKKKVIDVHDKLHKWDKDVLKSPMKRMKDLQRELERLRRGPMTDANMASLKEIMVHLELCWNRKKYHGSNERGQTGSRREIETQVIFIILL